MKPLKHAIYRLRRFDERVCHAFDLWARLDYSWGDAWEIAGTWQ